MGQAKSRVIHMRTPWTLSTIETLIFVLVVITAAGAGTWASVSPSRPIDQVSALSSPAPMSVVAAALR